MQFIVDTYILEYVESENKYYISFKDSVDKDCKIEINKKVFNEYVESRKSYIKIKNETSRYLEHSNLSELTLYNRSFKKQKSVEDEVLEKIRNDKLSFAENILTQTQKRRIKLHIKYGLTLEYIAKKENCSVEAISKSVRIGISKLQKKLKNI